jgi:hypothetical protein
MAKARNVVMTPDAEEMSEKEVELLLEQRDKEALQASEPAALLPVDDADVEAAAIAQRDEHIASFCATELPHAIDLAPINSKIVVILEQNVPRAMIATPSGVETLPEGDIAHKLPAGARIQKLAADRFEAMQLGATVVQPLLVTASGTEAIAAFIGHFHARED